MMRGMLTQFVKKISTRRLTQSSKHKATDHSLEWKEETATLGLSKGSRADLLTRHVFIVWKHQVIVLQSLLLLVKFLAAVFFRLNPLYRKVNLATGNIFSNGILWKNIFPSE